MKETTVRIHMNNGVVVLKHNERDEELVKYEKHIAKDFGTHEVWVDGTLTDTYTDLFKAAIDDYDSKQKRKDRKIGGVSEYIAQVEDNKQGRKQRKTVNGKKVVEDGTERMGKRVCSELIIGCGNTNMMKNESGHFVYRDDMHEFHHMRLPYEVSYAATKRYCDGWQKRNETEDGGMRIIRVDWHADEFYKNIVTGKIEMSTEHAHLAFVPWSKGFKRGMDTQNSMNKALQRLGYVDGVSVDENGKEKWSCAYDKWLSREREVYEAILEEEYNKYCRQHTDYSKENGALKIVHPYKDKNAANLPTELYRDVQEGKKELDMVNIQRKVLTDALMQKQDDLQWAESQVAQVEADIEANKAEKEATRLEKANLLADRMMLSADQMKFEEDKKKEYEAVKVQKKKADDMLKDAEAIQQQNEKLKKENEDLKAKLQQQYDELMSYVKGVQQSVQEKAQELLESLEYIAKDDTEGSQESEVETEARRLREARVVTYKGHSYTVESIVQASIKQATKIVNARREDNRNTKKVDVKNNVQEFIDDTEDMLKKYDGIDGLSK